MERRKVTAQQVKTANQRFYDAVADCYESIDGRRSSTLAAWLRKNLFDIRQQVSGDHLLDIGVGSGLVTRCAEGLFSWRVGIDLSPKILAAHRSSFDQGAAADGEDLPFANASFEVVTCFAVLHHLYTFEGLVAEAARVLKPGGIFYSDHDMTAAFARHFRWPLWLYRRLCNTRSKYLRASRLITPELYELTEWQDDGIDVSKLIYLFERASFSAEARYHWFGLAPMTDVIFGTRGYACRRAPLVSLIAVKARDCDRLGPGMTTPGWEQR